MPIKKELIVNVSTYNAVTIILFCLKNGTRHWDYGSSNVSLHLSSQKHQRALNTREKLCRCIKSYLFLPWCKKSFNWNNQQSVSLLIILREIFHVNMKRFSLKALHKAIMCRIFPFWSHIFCLVQCIVFEHLSTLERQQTLSLFPLINFPARELSPWSVKTNKIHALNTFRKFMANKTPGSLLIMNDKLHSGPMPFDFSRDVCYTRPCWRVANSHPRSKLKRPQGFSLNTHLMW